MEMSELRPELDSAQRNHLVFLEQWGSKSRVISGVPIMQVFTYELIQIFNNLYLHGLLGDEDA